MNARGVKREKRKKEIKRKKNFLPSLIVTLVLWVVLGSFVYFVNPERFGAIPFFFITLAAVVLFTSSFILANTRRGILATISIIIFAGFSYFGVGNLLNFALLIGAAIAFEIYFLKR